MSEVRSWIKSVYRKSNLYPVLAPRAEHRRQAEELRAWAGAGGPEGPAPHLLKQGVVRAAARRVGTRVLVETGTYLGTMIEAMRSEMDRVISIEVDEALHALARHRFRRADGVTLLRGDSATKMREALVVAGGGPVVFWLDGHFSGGETGFGQSHCPVREELAVILERGARDAILIDDAHCFGVDPAYPPIAELEAIVTAARPDCRLELRHNVIGFFPRP